MAYVPKTAYGPWLRYQNLDLATNAWTGSVLVLSFGPQPPLLTLSHTGHQFNPQPTCLDTFQNFNFWRWQLDLQLMPQESAVDYSVTAEWSQGQSQARSYRFHLAGANQTWHWGFHSCNGFSHGVDASWEAAGTALWKDVLQVHASMPLHCMAGGGDQLYCDGLFAEPAMVEWLKIADRKKRETTPVTPQIDAQISHFIFHHYANWFSKEDMAQAFATIPQVMTWDDHDIYDGYGSYPDDLQNCAVFQHAFKLSRRFYLAFQQHTNLDLAHSQANLFGVGQTFSMVRLMGRGVALVAPDVRAERTRKQVVSPESWKLIFDRVAALPPSVRHIVVLTTIPVVYPKIPLSEKAMGMMSTLGRTAAIDTVLQKTGLWGSVKGKVVSHFEEPELLDDLLDHWTSDFHTKEREMLIRHLQSVAQGRNTRITFISGDVHVAGLGRLYSYPKTDFRKDFRFMTQVVSSAIINAPPPNGVVAVLHKCSNAHMSGVDKQTKEKMVRIFKKDYPNTPKLLPKRNWATLWELPPNQPPPAVALDPSDPPLQAGDLLVVLRVEADHKQYQLPVKQYPIGIPTLEPLGGAYGVTVPGNVPHPAVASQAHSPSASAGYYSSPNSAPGASPQQQYSPPAGQQYPAPYPSGQQYPPPYAPGQTAGAPQQYAGGSTQYSPQSTYGSTQPGTGGYPGPAGGYNAPYAQPSGDVYQQFGNMSLGGTQGAASYPQNTQGAYPQTTQGGYPPNPQGAPQQPYYSHTSTTGSAQQQWPQY